MDLMIHGFAVHRMRNRHVDSVKCLEKQSRLSPWSIKDYRLAIADSKSICLVVEQSPGSDIILGFAVGKIILDGLAETAGEAEIYSIAVDAGFRRKGIGGYLLREIMDAMKKRQIGKVWLEVRKSNASAISFYREFGFDARHERMRYYSEPIENAAVMCLEMH